MAIVTLIDTYSVFFRAYYALPMMHTTSGEPTSAMYGFCSLLLKVLREQKPTELIFALDGPKQTFRKARYSEYKAQRASLPHDLCVQIDRLGEFLKALALPVFASPGFEADDVLATLAKDLRERQKPALVVSGDRDLLQTAHGTVRVLFIGARGKESTVYDEQAVIERFGVSATKLPSFIALVGDTSDNLPGVPGVGPRTAAMLLQKYGNVAELMAHLDEIKPQRVRDGLHGHAAQLQLNEELARLHDDVPLVATSFAAELTPAIFQRLRQLFEELEFRSLSARLDKLEMSWPNPG